VQNPAFQNRAILLRNSSCVEPDYLTAEEDDELDELLDVIRPIPKPPIAPARIPIIASMMKLSNIEPLLRPMAGPPWNISTVAGGF